MKTIGLFILFQFFTFSAMASDHQEQHKVQLMLKSKNIATFSDSLRKIKKWESLNIQCEIELETHRLPLTCLSRLKLEKEIKFITTGQYQKMTNELNQMCLSRFDDTCANSAKRQAKIDLYRQKEEQPLNYFQKMYE
jgi:hypothetical protein